MTENQVPPPVMPPAEVELLLGDLCAELVSSADTTRGRERIGRLTMLLRNFVHDWRQLCALHGTTGSALPEFRRLAAGAHTAAKPLAEGLVMRTNGVRALHVLEARVLRHLVQDAEAVPRRTRLLERPVFIVAAPRSGSTLLFETLACSPAFNTLGGEAHWLVENLDALRPGAPGVESNRLTAAHATAAIATAIREAALSQVQGPGGVPPCETAPLLEKTPKNALRIGFLSQVFPDARFILLWRDPRENLASIMDAWQSGDWITYPALPGWEGPWSLLLPPEWPSLRGAPLVSIAAQQWRQANEIALDDLQALPRAQWTAVSYHALLADPEATVRRLCGFAGVPFDEALRLRTRGALPLSRFTLTAPAAGKWRRHEAAITAVLPGIEGCWQRLSKLD